MEKEIVFSVVMPVYGVEKHLKKAVESRRITDEKNAYLKMLKIKDR